MKRAMLTLCVVLSSILTSHSVTYAQATAQIAGTAKDQSGAVLPGVEVTATQTETGITRSAVTNETGSFALPNLAVGPYRLEASLPGFRTWVQSGIVLQVGSNPVINPILEVGQVNEQIEVQANPVQVETRNVSVGAVVDNQRILELPLNGRNATELITLSGAAVSLGGEALGGRDIGGAPRLQVAGGSVFTVGYTLDGANYYNMMGLSSLPMPFPDALQEFKVDTSGVSTQEARAAGVSAVTKSGTNDIHGSLFEFVRNDLFNARNYFATKQSTLKRNQFGGTLGGPIKQNKLFYFGGLQVTTTRSDPSDVQAFLPTPAMLAGDWTTFSSPACNAGRTIALRAPFVNNRIDPSQYSKAGVELVRRVLAKAPTPNDCGLVIFGTPTRDNTWQAVGKVDYQWSAKHSVFGRYTVLGQKRPNGLELTPNNLLNSNVEGVANLTQSFALGSTYLLGPNVVNAFRLTANRARADQTGPEFFSFCDVGVNMYCGYTPKRIFLMVTSGFNIGTGHVNGNTNWSQHFEAKDDVNLVRGTHQISAGASLGVNRGVVYDDFYSSGRTVVTGQATGHGLADLLTGRLTQMTQSGRFDYFVNKQWFPVVYGADTWKANSKLTLNYGIRWQPFLPAELPGKTGHVFDMNRFLQGTKSTVYPNAPAGWYFVGDPGFPGTGGGYPKWGLFAPRLGLAWDVEGNGRTSIRASFSLAYSVVGGHWEEGISQDAPFGASNVTVLNPVLDNPWASFPGGNPFPRTTATFPVNAPFHNMKYDRQAPYTESWNLGVQRQIKDWLVSATYLGSQQVHDWWGTQINPAMNLGFGPCTLNGVAYNPCTQAGNVSARRLLTLTRPQDGALIDTLWQLDDGGTGSYHGMLLSAQHRFSNRYSFQANYTWSHCINESYVSSTTGSSSQGGGYNDPFNRGYDRGDCVGDRRHIINMTGVVQMPAFANSGRVLHLIAGGWQLAPIYRWSSGAPLNVLAGSDRALNGNHDLNGNILQRGNQILENPYGTNTGVYPDWLNRAAFDIPALGTYGTFRRNSVVGPATWSFDAALSKSFAVRESRRLEVRAEAFNVLNSFRPGNPNANLTSAQFGQVRTALDPRIMQFALKYVF